MIKRVWLSERCNPPPQVHSFLFNPNPLPSSTTCSRPGSSNRTRHCCQGLWAADGRKLHMRPVLSPRISISFWKAWRVHLAYCYSLCSFHQDPFHGNLYYMPLTALHGEKWMEILHHQLKSSYIGESNSIHSLLLLLSHWFFMSLLLLPSI